MILSVIFAQGEDCFEQVSFPTRHPFSCTVITRLERGTVVVFFFMTPFS
jgi:hypothetical protein